jgi:hypothetical protein
VCPQRHRLLSEAPCLGTRCFPFVKGTLAWPQCLWFLFITFILCMFGSCLDSFARAFSSLPPPPSARLEAAVPSSAPSPAAAPGLLHRALRRAPRARVAHASPCWTPRTRRGPAVCCDHCVDLPRAARCSASSGASLCLLGVCGGVPARRARVGARPLKQNSWETGSRARVVCAGVPPPRRLCVQAFLPRAASCPVSCGAVLLRPVCVVRCGAPARGACTGARPLKQNSWETGLCVRDTCAGVVRTLCACRATAMCRLIRYELFASELIADVPSCLRARTACCCA